MNVKFPDSDIQLRAELVRYGRLLYRKGYIVATDGNMSVRLGSDRILCTPSGVCKGMMGGHQMVITDLDGNKVSGTPPVSSEIGMHVAIYRRRPDINAVVHAHPCTATGFASAGIPLTEPLCSEVVLMLGKIPLAPYGTPGSSEVAQSLLPLIADHDAILMANHGVVSYGPTLARAYRNMETVEHFAKIMLVTRQLGRCEPLSSERVRELEDLRYRCMQTPAGPSLHPISARIACPAPTEMRQSETGS